MSIKWQIAFRIVSQFYNVWIRCAEIGYDSRHPQIWFPFTMWREYEIKCYFAMGKGYHFFLFFLIKKIMWRDVFTGEKMRMRAACDIQINHFKWEMNMCWIGKIKNWFQDEKSWKRNNEHCDCAFILKIIYLYLWTSICTVKTECFQCFFEKECENNRDSYQQSFSLCFWNVPNNM